MNQTLEMIIFSIKENVKTKLYLVLTLFCVILIFIGLLLTGLSGFEQPYRVLVNTGLSMIELFCLFIILLNSAGIVLQDIENKSVYLILSKPVSRFKYVVDKYIGFLCVIVINVFFMSLIHLVFIKISKGEINYFQYILVIFSIILKVSLISAITLFLVISMTSQTAAVITSFLIWIAGHFLTEFKFIIDRNTNFVIKSLMEIVYYLIPNFQYFNLKDFYDDLYLFSRFNIFFGLGYWVVYTTIVVILTAYVFNKKDL
jgi:ABC-type transport system involved in multi-copper enzyme maturation permease subunit